LFWQLCDVISKWEQDYIQCSGSHSDLTRTIRLLYKSRYSSLLVKFTLMCYICGCFYTAYWLTERASGL